MSGQLDKFYGVICNHPAPPFIFVTGPEAYEHADRMDRTARCGPHRVIFIRPPMGYRLVPDADCAEGES